MLPSGAVPAAGAGGIRPRPGLPNAPPAELFKAEAAGISPLPSPFTPTSDSPETPAPPGHVPPTSLPPPCPGLRVLCTELPQSPQRLTGLCVHSRFYPAKSLLMKRKSDRIDHLMESGFPLGVRNTEQFRLLLELCAHTRAHRPRSSQRALQVLTQSTSFSNRSESHPPASGHLRKVFFLLGTCPPDH